MHDTGVAKASLIAFKHSAELALVGSQIMLALVHASSQFWPQSPSTHSLLCAFAEHADATVSGGGGGGGGDGAGLSDIGLRGGRVCAIGVAGGVGAGIQLRVVDALAVDAGRVEWVAAGNAAGARGAVVRRRRGRVAARADAAFGVSDPVLSAPQFIDWPEWE